MKKVKILLLLLAPLISQAQLNEIIKTVNKKSTSITKYTGNVDISAGLKEALNKGISEQVSQLTAMNGFYKNQAVKILMPAELAKVDKTLRRMGLSKLADEGVLLMNRAAEEAVKEATPIFVSAVKNLTITDAKDILLGKDDAATRFLETKTTTELYSKFKPVVQESMGKVGADVVWTTIITKYNSVPFVTKINPDITDYVTDKALEGVFKMIAVEELKIRDNLNARTSNTLKEVFKMQDKK